jgi:hypothetical protein
MCTAFCFKCLKGRDDSNDLVGSGNNIKVDLKEIGYGDLDWINGTRI